MLKIEKLRNKYDESNIGKVMLDQNLVIIFINTTAAKILKAEKKIALGRNILLYLTCANRKFIIPKIEKFLKTTERNSNHRYKVKSILFKENNLLFKITINPKLTHNTNNRKEIILHLQPKLQIEKKTLLTSKKINNLSHDLRAPLFNIRSFLETLYEYNDELTSSQRLEFLEIATNETNRLNNLVKDILDLAEIENQNTPTNSQSSIENIIREILELHKLIAINKKIMLIKNTDSINKDLVICGSSIIRILSNLLNNSIKFTYPRGIINLQTKTLQSSFLQTKNQKLFLRIALTDTGIGIAKKYRKNIFNRFSRGNEKTNIITGSGLGLPIVKDTLTKQNKKFNFLTNLNKGTSASFNLPHYKAGEGT